MTMPCLDFFQRSGWRCAEVQNGAGRTLYISTPLTFMSGAPLDYFAIDRGASIELTDDGTLIFALRSAGYPLQSAIHWRSLETLARGHGVSLTEDGAFTLIDRQEHLPQATDRWLRFLSGLAQWDKEKHEEKDVDLTLMIEVERVLLSIDPLRELRPSPEIWVGEVALSFDFKWGTTYVDAVPLHASATNSRLRKAILMSRAEAVNDMLFVVDDRQSIDRCDREVALIGQIAKAVALRNLRNFASAA